MNAEETPYPGREEVLRLKGVLSDLRYRRDIRAEFVATAEIVYDTFEVGVHVREFEFNPELPLYAASDFGYEDPWVTLWIQEDPSQDRVLILDEYWHTHRTTAVNVEAVKARQDQWGGMEHLKGMYPDPSGAEARAALKAAGFHCSIRGGNDIESGVDRVREWLRVREDGRPGLIVHPRCLHTIDEFQTYHNDKSDKPADEDNHTMDPLRYYFLNRKRRRTPRIRALKRSSANESTDTD